MKKLVSLILSVVLVFAMLPVIAVPIRADTYGDWEYDIPEPGIATITKYNGSTAVLNVPTYLNGFKVTGIAANAFRQNSHISLVTIPDQVTSIGRYAFCGCSALSSVTLPLGLTGISEGLFQDCTNMTTAAIPVSVTQIDSYAFYGCSSLLYVSLPDTLTSIGSYAFYGCSSLETGYNAGSYEQWYGLSVGDGNGPLKEATVWHSTGPIVASGACGAAGDNVTWTLTREGALTISGTGAMKDYLTTSGGPWNGSASSITSIEIGAGVTHTGDYAFSGCGGLYSVTIPLSVTSFGCWSFYQCDNLRHVYYGGSISNWNQITGDIGDPLEYAEVHFAVDPVVISEITVNKTSAVAGDTVTWTAAASGGTGPLQYAFYVYKNGTIVKRFGYSTSASRSWKLSEAGNYHVKAYVKDGSGTAVTKTGGAVIAAPAGPVITAVTADKTSAAVGDTVTWTTTAGGGTGTLLYAFYIYKDGAIVKKFGYSTSSFRSYKPTEPGAYQVRAYVKDGNGSVKSQLGGSVAVDPGPPVITGVTADKTTAAAGDTVTWTTAASGGTGALQYAFYIYKDGAIVKKFGYSTSSSRSYKPTEPGVYQVRAYVKDGNGAVRSKMGGAVTVTAPVTPVITGVTMNRTSCSTGDTITWTVSATGGTGTLKYAFYLYQDGTIIQKTSYSTAKTFSYTPAAAGSYKVKAFVKDSAGKSSSKLSGICLCSLG